MKWKNHNFDNNNFDPWREHIRDVLRAVKKFSAEWIRMRAPHILFLSGPGFLRYNKRF